jgi:hypothetical protein
MKACSILHGLSSKILHGLRSKKGAGAIAMSVWVAVFAGFAASVAGIAGALLWAVSG